ncbi:MAG: hypothetical protein AM326_03385 [Candidatus Thorarchaeota archaeon SMTZ-45]|nr:MAG: hypothetical protein AM326_03385 [Candidatus Thorarchaeota archaeon SMTZ-45]
MKQFLIVVSAIFVAGLVMAGTVYVDSTGVYTPAYASRSNSFTADQTISNAGSNNNSYKILVVANDGGVAQTGSFYTAQGNDPYLRISAPNDAGAETGIIDIHDQVIAFVNDATTDIGTLGANRPKNIYASGGGTFGGDLIAVGGHFTADLQVDGTDIGMVGDLDLIKMDINILTVNGDLRVEGSEVGTSTDTDLISMADNALTINGTLSPTGDMNAPSGTAMELTYWYQDNVAASQTDAVLNMDGNTSRPEVPTIRSGSVIGIALYTNEARSAGTLTADVTVDGTKTGLTAVLDDATQTKTTTQAKDTDTFTAGQRIGVKLTTDGTWAPITADITVTVLVEQ